MSGRGRRAVALGTLAVWACMLIAAGAAKAEVYLFDPVLSLSGNCAEPSVDPVPDPAEPACPSDEGGHPASSFSRPTSVATDRYGNIYIGNFGPKSLSVDVFDGLGFFLGEVVVASPVQDVAVDGDGFLYVLTQRQSLFGEGLEPVVERFDPEPETYDPSSGEISYDTGVVILDEGDGLGSFSSSIFVDSDGHLYINRAALSAGIDIYSSAIEGNTLIESKIGAGSLERAKWVTVDSRNGDIYVGSRKGFNTPSETSVVKVFSAAAGHSLKRTISGFSSGGDPSVAIDETRGYILVGDVENRNKVYVFPDSNGDQEAGEAVEVIEHNFEMPYLARISSDNGTSSPNMSYLFVSSQSKGGAPPDHVYAFEPIEPPTTPQVKVVTTSEVTESEAQVEAVINPGNAETTYEFEYVSEEMLEASGFTEATVFGEGTIAAGNQDVAVSAPIAGLSPETSYRVRAVADNCSPEEPERECTDAGEASLTTYPEPEPIPPCSNDAIRVGPSAHLPDCRAYELVTPPGSGGRPPHSVGVSGGDNFGTPTATADGDSISFVVDAGGLPGLGGAGAFFGDGYLAERSSTGWQTRLVGPSGAQMSNPEAGGLSPDHEFAAWSINAFGSGELASEGAGHYILYPDSTFHLAGSGSLEVDRGARVRSITKAGSHTVFEAEKHLEPQAPSSGTRALYDRMIDPITAEETTHVVSLLPEEVTPEEGQGVTYEGSSTDGTAIAFKLGNTTTSPLYVRINNVQTLIAAEEPGAEFAGLSQEGRYLFYELEGDLFRFDTEIEETAPVAKPGDAVMVNVPAEGTSAYFVSQSALTGEEENSEGDKAAAGEWNLYVWDGEDISFIGTVTKRDVEGEPIGNNVQVDGLGLWASVPTGGKPVTTGQTSRDPSRTTPEGTVLLFESRASLTGYDSDGKTEIYRFDLLSGDLRCVSCNPTKSAAGGDARLQTVGVTSRDGPAKTSALIPNLSSDGRRAFFESSDPLVLADTDGTQDVYEWEEGGVGSCERPGGCIYLISSGHSARPNYLYGASESGDDVFFTTSDLLTQTDHDATPSIYDARVGGGFAEPEETTCVSESCKPEPTPPPALLTPAPPSQEGPEPRRHCPKGKHRVERNGKVRCVKRHRKHSRRRRHHRSGGSQ